MRRRNCHSSPRRSNQATSGCLGLIYFSIASGVYIISFWLPSIIKQTGVSDPFSIGLLTAIPYIFAIVAMILVNQSGDRMRERRWHTVIPCLVTAVGLALTALAGGNTILAMIGLTLGAAGVSAAQSCFWTLPSLVPGRRSRGSGYRARQLPWQHWRFREHVPGRLDDGPDAQHLGWAVSFRGVDRDQCRFASDDPREAGQQVACAGVHMVVRPRSHPLNQS